MSHLLNGMLLGTQLSKTRTYQEQIKYMLGSSLFAWYPLNELSGVSGTSVADIGPNGYTGKALQSFTGGFTGPGTGKRTSIYTTGSFLGINTFSAAEAAAFKTQCGDHGFVCGWGKADDWVGTANNIINYQSGAGVDSINFNKNNTNDRMQLSRTANSATKVVAETSGQTSLAWRWYLMTWDTTTDQLITYTNNVQFGTTQTGLAVWQNNLATAGSLLLTNWLGLVMDIIIGSRVLTATERAYIYNNV